MYKIPDILFPLCRFPSPYSFFPVGPRNVCQQLSRDRLEEKREMLYRGGVIRVVLHRRLESKVKVNAFERMLRSHEREHAWQMITANSWLVLNLLSRSLCILYQETINS